MSMLWFAVALAASFSSRPVMAHRLFLVPGMGHCGGGPATLDTFDMLGAVVDWVEGQKPPQAIRATGRSWPGRSRPLCPYPSHAHYKGTGDVEDAASFECR